MSSNFTCEYCSSTFSSKSNLQVHMKRTKKCLKLRNQSTEDDDNLFTCYKCDKKFTSKQSLNEHFNHCSIQIDKYMQLEKNYQELLKNYEIIKTLLKEKEKQNHELKEENKILQEQIRNIAEIGAKKDTTITNNTIKVNNRIIQQLAPFDLTREKIENIVNEKFTEKHLLAKENGIAYFAINNLLKDDETGKLKMMCTDTARKIFIYKDENGDVFKDPDASEFTKMYIPPLERKSYKLMAEKDAEDDNFYNYIDFIGEIKENPSIISNKLSKTLVSKPN